jgi:hypothetical protein
MRVAPIRIASAPAAARPRRGGIFAVLAERPHRVDEAQKEKEHG